MFVRERYLSLLDSVVWLRKVDIGAESLAVYENRNFQDRWYSETSQIGESGIPETVSVPWHFRSPTEYAVTMRDLYGTGSLNFSERYHPDWKIRIGAHDWLDSLLDREYYLDGISHVQTVSKQNSWEISKDRIVSYVRDHYSDELEKGGYPKKLPNGKTDYRYYVQDIDGSIDVEVTAYYRPQAYWYLGLAFSGLVLLGCVGYLIRHFLRKP